MSMKNTFILCIVLCIFISSMSISSIGEGGGDNNEYYVVRDYIDDISNYGYSLKEESAGYESEFDHGLGPNEIRITKDQYEEYQDDPMDAWEDATGEDISSPPDLVLVNEKDNGNKKSILNSIKPTWSVLGDTLNFLTSVNPNAGGVMSLIRSEDELNEKKQEADKWMHKHLFPGSKEYYLNTICAAKIPTMSENYAFVQVDERIEVVANVMGERREIIVYNETNTGDVENKPMYQYKLSYFVSNNDPENKTLKFNVFVKGSNGRKKLYNNTIELEIDDTFSKQGRNARKIISENYYDEIFIDFFGNPPRIGPKTEEKDLTDPLRNKIVDKGDIGANDYNRPSYIEEGSSSSSGSSSGQSVDSTKQDELAI